MARAAQLPYASSLCGACREVCPVKIDIPELLLHLRAEITEGPEEVRHEVESRKRRTSERVAFKLWAVVMTRPWLYELSGRVLRALQSFVVRGGKIGRVGKTFQLLAPPLTAWTAARDLRPIERRSFREQWRDKGKSNS